MKPKRRYLLNKPHFVYLLKQGDVVVYVGCTSNLKSRMASHKDKPHNNVEVISCRNKMEGLYKERILLIIHRPKLNWIPDHIIEKRDSGVYPTEYMIEQGKKIFAERIS